jgi:hypothetical protein
MMNYANSLQNNDSYSNNLRSSQSFQMEQSSSNTLYNTFNYIDYSSATDNNIVPASSYIEQQQPTSFFAGDEHATTRTTQPFPHPSQYTPQYNSYDISPPFSSPNMIPNSFQNHSEVFRFEIPGFKIIIIPNFSPNSSNLDNLDTQNQSQVFTSPNIATDNSQTRFQQNSNESLTNINNFNGQFVNM